MEGLGFNAGVHGIASSFCFNEGIENRKQPARVSALGRSVNCNLVESSSRKKVSSSRSSSLMNSLRSVWHNGEKENGVVSVSEACVADVKEDEVVVEEEEEKEEEEEIGLEERKGNWILKILQIRSAWKEKSERNSLSVLDESSNGSCSCDKGGSKAFAIAVDDKEEGKEEEEKFNRDSFSRLLRRVSLTEAILYARLSYLGHLAYSIPKIKPENLLKYHRLRFITSSTEKKAQAMNSEQKEQTSAQILEAEDKPNEAVKEDEEQKKTRSSGISASAAYQIAASAASYLQNCTQSILPFKSPETKIREGLAEGCNGNAEIEGSEAASFVATTDSLTAVVAAKEEMKQAVAKDLNSIHSSPCDWFICDDDQSGTRIFVIQGSESLASWQANLLFEPIHFEGLDVLVHRGIYEAAKGIYEQILPEVHAHLKARESATLCFTGHSLGGSLSLLINLMLLIRGEVTVSSLLPVVTFGAPTIMCGGDQLLRRLGLPRNHVQTITMHRDIVPRAFACSYPSRVVELLRAVNSNFRNHPCLCNQKFLYAPMGDILILQPDEKISPQHDLLPPGIGLYYLTDHSSSGSGDPEKKLLAAQTTFLNSPHPLEILSDRSAYGSSGAICRDHDMRSYLRSVRSVIRQELKRIEKEMAHARQVWWPFFSSRSVNSNNIYVSGWMASSNVTPPQLKLSSIFQTGKESWKRVRRLIASQNIHLLAVLLFPTRVSFFSAHTFMGFH